MSNVRLARKHTTKLAGFSAALLLALAGGCGGEDQAVKEIQKAEQTMRGLTTDGTFTSLNDEHRMKQLKAVYSSMKSIADSGSPELQVSAMNIASRAQSGIASLQAKAAIEADKSLDAQLSALRAAIDTYTLQKSIAEANSGAGTQGLIKTLQTSLEANKKAAADASKAASQVQATVDELSTRSNGFLAQATAKRQEAASIAARMQGVSATEGLEILKRSTVVLAEADALEQKSSELETTLGMTKAELARARATAAALEEQSKQLQGDISSAQTRLDEEHKLAESAGKVAESTFADIKKKFSDLSTFRAKLDAAHQEVVTATSLAYEHAKKAGDKAAGTSSGARDAAVLATATMQQNYADALVSKARMQDRIADTLAFIAGAKPALPNAEEFAKAAADARKESDDALLQARETYGTVKTLLDNVNDESLKAKAQQTQRLLDTLSGKQGVPAATPAAPAGEAPADGAPNAAVSEIRKLIDQVQDKIRASDTRGIADLFDFPSDAERQSFIAMTELADASNALNAACQEKFGKSFAEIMGGNSAAMASMLPDPAAERTRTSSDFDIEVSADGNSATVTPKTPLGPMDMPRKVHRKDGAWRLSAEGIPAGGLGPMAQLGPILKGFAADVKAGKYESAEQFKTAVTSQMGSLFGGGLVPPSGGGGEEDPNK